MYGFFLFGIVRDKLQRMRHQTETEYVFRFVVYYVSAISTAIILFKITYPHL